MSNLTDRSHKRNPQCRSALALAMVAWSLLLAGCHEPIRVSAIGDIKMTADLPPVANAEPVVRMVLPGSCPDPSAPTVAVVDVDGLLVNSDLTGLYSAGENPVSLFRERLDAVASDYSVRAVVLRINSPGGGVTATDVMWHDLQRFKRRSGLPVVACLLDVGAGGAYYLATAADSIVAHPTTITGGIGVIMNVYNLNDALAQFNVVAAPIKAGPNIDLGTPITALSDDRKQLLQTMADEFHTRFKQIVLEARPGVDAKDGTNFDGRVFTAQQACERRLIDKVGYLDNAVALCQQSINVKHVRIVLYHRPNDPARSPYAITPNVPLHGNLIPFSLPGFDRSRLPGFLYMWQPEPTMEKLGR